MLAYAVGEISTVERDMELIRDVLLKVEANPEMDGTRQFMYTRSEELGISGYSPEELAYHVKLLIEGGFLKGSLEPGYIVPPISRLTMDGHDFLDSIRDPDIWTKTKKRLDGIASVTLKVVYAIAESEIKKKLGLS